jgi:hypothetical protein
VRFGILRILCDGFLRQLDGQLVIAFLVAKVWHWWLQPTGIRTLPPAARRKTRGHALGII